MKKLICVFLLPVVMYLCSCTNNMEYKINQLKDQIILLEREIDDKNEKIEKLKNDKNEISDNSYLSINYIENSDSKRFIEEQRDLLAIPVDNSLIMRTIDENTVVTVIDTAVVDDLIWFYISIPVYDTPNNYKGWVRETDSIPYTESLKAKVLSEIIVKPGEDIYATIDFADIGSIPPYTSENEIRGRITIRKEDYLQLTCAGGEIIWVKESSVIYPPID
ncbi:MAG: hypothetical protein ACYC5K_09540 [Saccharofermentanales bacterium]